MPRSDDTPMSAKTKVAIIDDEADMRSSIGQWLALSGYDPVSFSGAEAANRTSSFISIRCRRAA